MKNQIISVSLVVSGICAAPVPACDLCALYSANQASGLTGQGFCAGVAEQYTDSGTLQDTGQKISNDDQEYIHSSVSQLFAGYNFNSRIGLQLNLPLISRSYGWTGFHGYEWGPGDLTLNANLRVWHVAREDFTFDWQLSGGIKFPTGDTSWLGPRGAGITALGIGGHDLALGSGSFDGLVGTSVSARWKHVFFNAGTQYAIRSEGDFNHRYANDLTWAGGPGVYLALNDNYTLALQAVVSGEAKGKDTQDGIPDPDSAATLVYVGPQLNFTWRDKASLQVGLDVPVSRYNSDVQLLPDYRLRAALTWRF